jgi:hypothetical protein
MAVYWLLSFAGWKVLEYYSPAVYGSLPAGNLSGFLSLDPDTVRKAVPPGTTSAQVLEADEGLAEVEARFNEILYSAQYILRAGQMEEADWPRNIPSPEADRALLVDHQGHPGGSAATYPALRRQCARSTPGCALGKSRAGA